MKKFLSLLLALVMLFALGSTAFAAKYPDSGFKDIPKGAWYEDAVNFAKAQGLMNGVADDRFDPNGKVTRAMVVTVLYRLADQPSVSGQNNPFVDVSNDKNNWYRDAVIWAAKVGVTDGVDANHFAPNTPINREQMASMIIRFLTAFSEGESADLKKVIQQLDTLDPKGTQRMAMLREEYKDADSVSSWARTNVLVCKLAGIMNGDDKGMFRPKDTLTRAECAQTFLNLYEIGMSS